MIWKGEPEVVRDLYLPDTHTPYHDRRALNLIIDHIIPGLSKYSRVPWRGLRIGGDWFDNYTISRFKKDPRREKSLRREHEVGLGLLDRLDSAADWQEKEFLLGNHEKRLEDFLKEHAPELYDYVMKSSDGYIARLKAKGWKIVPYMQDTRTGRINHTHDIGFGGAQALQRTLHSYQDNVVMNHVHTLDWMVRANAKGTPHVGAIFGWLGDYRKIDYKHRAVARRQWVLGFGVGHAHVKNGYTWLTPVPIIGYSALVEGRYFKG